MKCVIGGNTYTAMDSLNFSPQADLTGNSLPINEFEVRLFTNDVISYGQYAELRDDLDNLWAKYWISYAERIGRDVDRGTYVVKLIAQSSLAFLERIKIPAKMYNGTAVSVFNDIMTLAGQTGVIVLDSEVSTAWQSITINGFCPEQTARERLLWLTLCAGGYIETYFGNVATIRKIDISNPTLIPIEKIFWKPTISHRDYVTKIRIHAYTYTQGTPTNVDEYVTDGSTYWIVTNHTITLSNSNVPSGVPENVVEIENITLISPDNASTIVNNLVAYYFDRTEIDCDVIDNYAYKPGDLVTLYTDEDQLYTGYIDSVGFSFGVQARGKLHLTPCAATDGAFLTIVYKWEGITLNTRIYYLPKGYPFAVTTEYIDLRMGGHRYVFRPTQNVITGTLTENSTVNVTCEIALDSFAITTTIRQDAINDKNLLIKWLNEARLSGRDAVIEMLNNVYAENMATMSNTAQVVHVLSVDGLEKSVTSTDKTIYINGDHRIDGHNDGE